MATSDNSFLEKGVVALGLGSVSRSGGGGLRSMRRMTCWMRGIWEAVRRGHDMLPSVHISGSVVQRRCRNCGEVVFGRFSSTGG